jgi:hypothetical protein
MTAARPYPEHEKLTKVADVSQQQGLFVDGLRARGLPVCRFAHYYRDGETVGDHRSEGGDENCTRECGYEPMSGETWLLKELAEFHGIDYDALMAEKEELFKAMRAIARANAAK